MMGRALWIVAMIALAAVVSYAQLDRQSRYSPELAVGVPAPFRGFAQGHVTATVLAGENANQALAEAQRLVKSRPIPAEHLRLLATAQLKAGKGVEAARTIQIAAKRGWRDPQAQEAMLRIALAVGDKAEATRRFAALLQNPASKDDVLTALGPLVFADAASASRKTMSDLMVDGVRWQARFLARGAQVMPADALVEIIQDSVKHGAKFDCAALKGATNTLTLRDAKAAEALDRIAASHC
jgi:hypothetical protein